MFYQVGKTQNKRGEVNKMVKFLFAILLILSIYIYATITPENRQNVNHTVALIPHHIGTVFNAISERAVELQDYDTEH
jgi:hypothetical protein